MPPALSNPTGSWLGRRGGSSSEGPSSSPGSGPRGPGTLPIRPSSACSQNGQPSTCSATVWSSSGTSSERRNCRRCSVSGQQDRSSVCGRAIEVLLDKPLDAILVLLDRADEQPQLCR